MTNPPISRKKSLKAGLIFLAMALILNGIGVIFLIQDLSTLKEEPAAGNILSSKVDTDRFDDKWRHRPSIHYQYKINGCMYYGSRIRGSKIPTPLMTAQRLVHKYPPGKAVDVYYDPQNPDSAILIRGIGFGPIVFLFFPFFCLLSASGALRNA